MATEEFERTLARELRRRRVVGTALIAIEAVIGGIDEDLYLGMTGYGAASTVQARIR